jgi:hypothetical protein
MVAFRSIPLQTDAFRGQCFSLLVRKTMLTVGSSAIAFPAGVAVFHSIELSASLVEMLAEKALF